jgi:hypothetical protein
MPDPEVERAAVLRDDTTDIAKIEAAYILL